VFTNLGRDHLDFHGTEEEYFAAKATLFTPEHAARAVVNLDDVHGRLLRDAGAIPTEGYSLDDLGDLESGPRGSTFTWRGHRVELGLPGRHNVANALAAAEAALLLGLPEESVAAALSSVPQVPGRFEAVGGPGGPAVVVDYAHTPDALANALSAASSLRGDGGTRWVVFGCGGDRDARKRPEMGRVATEMADRVVVTTDNPRSEDPLRIIEAIRSGCVGEHLVEADRRRAIHLAVSSASPGDVVLIAGKGHEQGQVFAEVTEPFDDRVVAAEALADSGWAP
jgi:UDP-N-acetylmuramoyl-L-alanyl-D-glutamate--2,6-diaminopimelate ligase